MKRINLPIILGTAFIGCIIMLVVLGSMSHSQTSETILSEPSTSATPRPFVVRGDIPYWDQDAAITSYTQHANVINQIGLFWYYLSEEGTIEKYEYAEEDTRFITRAKDMGAQVTVIITNLPEEDGTSWDSERVEYVIGDTTRRAQHIADIVNLVSQLDVDGVTIDYEEVLSTQQQNFSHFIAELTAQLHAHQKIVVVALHPKHEGESRYAYQDWKALSASADQLTLMAYGEHWDGGDAGPIASKAWLERIIRYTQGLNVPMYKFIFGIPLYGYDWEVDTNATATGLTYQDIRRILMRYTATPQWDTTAAAPYFHYTRAGSSHTVWYEDSRSVAEKVQLARNAGFGGVFFWRLGGEDPAIWNKLSDLSQN